MLPNSGFAFLAELVSFHNYLNQLATLGQERRGHSHLEKNVCGGTIFMINKNQQHFYNEKWMQFGLL